LRRRFKVLLTIPVLILLAVGVFFWAGRNTTLLIYPQVWSQSSPEGDSYEFKVNQFIKDDTELEVGFLSTMDRVMVTDPSGRTFELERDFNINEYSGEITRRFVLYDPSDGDLPETGKYRFIFLIGDEVKLTKHVDYVQDNLEYLTGVKWERREDDIFVEWTPPSDATRKNWYKVLIWNIGDTPQQFVSLRFDGDVSSGLLEKVPCIEGGTYQLNVAFFSNVGYAYSEYYNFIWDETASPLSE